MNDLGQLSLLTIYAAMASYALALVGFAVDLSALRSGRDAAGKVVRRAGVLAPAGAARSGAGGPSAAGGGAVGLPEVEAGRGGRRQAAGIAMSTLWLGVAFHGIGVVLRGVAAGHGPWSNMYEFTITSTFVGAALFLWLTGRRDLRYLGAFVTGPTLLLLGVATSVLYTSAEGLRPILDSYWLYIHVSIATIAVAVLAIAAVLAMLQLGKDFSGGSPASRWSAILSGLPGPATLEALSYRFTAVGFVLWTFTLVAGAIWAEHAWGRAWGWDAKEVWTFVIWVIYAAYLHARATRGWDGRRAAYLVLAGFGAILANYFVVNFLLSTKHGYAF